LLFETLLSSLVRRARLWDNIAPAIKRNAFNENSKS
jgi:hypothetical protein